MDGWVLFDGEQAAGPESDPFEAFFGSPVERGTAELTAGRAAEVSLRAAGRRPSSTSVRAVPPTN